MPVAELTHLLTTEEVAELLGVSTRTVHRLADNGRLPRIRLGHRTVRFSPESVAALIDAACGEERQ
jgi:excisionase family DNA binding protein